MPTNQTNLTKDINSFLNRNSNSKETLTSSLDLANKFLKDLPEYKENYTQEIIVSQIDCILATQVI